MSEPFVLTRNEEIEARLLIEALYMRYQQDFRGYSFSSVARRLLRAKENFGCRSLSMLQDLLLHEPKVLPELLSLLTIQVSDLFRDPPFYRALREQVLPHLATYPSLKVWICGCGEGEEVYSMAILFKEEGLASRTMFYATDISPRALWKAEQGVYDLARMPQFTENHRSSGGRSSLSDYYTAAYGRAVFDRRLRERVVFSDHNLASDEVFAEVHLVSCRNVLIYFDRELQDRSIGLFRGALVDNGFLCVGAKESVRFSRHADYFADFVGEHRIYRKRLPQRAAGEGVLNVA